MSSWRAQGRPHLCLLHTVAVKHISTYGYHRHRCVRRKSRCANLNLLTTRKGEVT